MARLEDRRFLTGRGRYLDDIQLPDMLHMAVLRSSQASARLTRVDTEPALAVPGVAAALTGAELEQPRIPQERDHKGLKEGLTPQILAVDRVRYLGEPVAAVVAENRYVAEDALEAVRVEYESEPVVGSLEEALAASSRVHEHVPDNIGASWRYQHGDAERAFREAEIVIRQRAAMNRGHGSPLETRGCIAHYDEVRQELSLWVTHQNPFRLRRAISRICGIPAHQIRVVSPDLGGGFGVKGRDYPEYFQAALLALRTKRPVKWVEDRREHLLASAHDREIVTEVELAATRDGRLLGLRGKVWGDMGAYIPYAFVAVEHCALHLAGPYRITDLDIEAYGVLTHKMPVGPYRATGRPNGIFAVERALDTLARKLDLDPVEIRRKNLIRPEQMPWTVGIGAPGRPPVRYDSGDYPAMLEKALEHLDYEGWRRKQEAARREGRYIGIGIACYVEGNRGGWENVTVRLEPSGRVMLMSGLPQLGQGSASTWAKLVAERLGLRHEDIDLVYGDTRAVAHSEGSIGARTTIVAANCSVMAAEKLADQIRDLAAQCLECAPEDLELADGSARVRGAPGRGITYRDLHAQLVEGRVATTPPGLEVSQWFRPEGQAWASGTHGLVLELDPDTAKVQILRYVAVDDCGRVLDPLLVEGQAIGAIAQAIGGSLYERLAYDDRGQLLAGTFMDYLIPTAMEIPHIDVLHPIPSRSPVNPLGVKGAGESGCMGGYAVVASAVEDALRPFGAEITRLPLTPADIHAACFRTSRAG